MFKENEELLRSESESNLMKWESPHPSSFLGNTGEFAQSDGTETDRQDENFEIITARVKRARVVYRPVNKKSKVTAAKLERCFAAEIGGKVCEWNVHFDICCGKNFIDIISLIRKR